MDQRKMTHGEFLVGISFNPGGNAMVNVLKEKAAALIDIIETIEPSANQISGEVQRLKALAVTHIEDAAMWAVKAATKQPL